MSNNGNTAPIRVALDAMGGDYGPPETVPGALAAMPPRTRNSASPWWATPTRYTPNSPATTPGIVPRNLPRNVPPNLLSQWRPRKVKSTTPNIP